MKTIKSTLFVLALSLLLGTPALAQTTSPAHTLSAHDLELLFEQDGEPLQLALLSEQEMAETEGAWSPFALRRMYLLSRWRVKIHYDRKPHDFKREKWGDLEGNRPHLQITIWRKGVKKSNWDWRIPAGPKQPKFVNPNPAITF